MTRLDTASTGNGRGQSERLSLRDVLRTATARDHARLDAALADLRLSSRHDLTRFLGIHLAARTGIERWLAARAAPGWAPPIQSSLILEDLDALGGTASSFPAQPFDPGSNADWLGPAYVIAGAHLGNRLLLAQAGAALPLDARRFLSGAAMQDYWRRLRVLLNEAPGPSGSGATVAGARATFAHFAKCVETFTDQQLAVA